MRRVTGVLLVLPAMMEFLDNLDFLDLQAPLDPLALAETFLLSCLEVMMRNLVALPWLFLAQWDPWALVVPLDLLDFLDLKVLLALLVSLVRLVLLVQWVPVVQLVLLERTEKMVSLASLVALVSVVLLAHRVPVDSLELPDFLVSRDTEVSVV